VKRAAGRAVSGRLNKRSVKSVDSGGENHTSIGEKYLYDGDLVVFDFANINGRFAIGTPANKLCVTTPTIWVLGKA
jgi:hypothetical protein